jgi:acetyl-CoA synthetase
VKQAANALIELGVKAGDRVAIYLPMIPEAVVAMLACARIGAPHTVVFGGFSADALSSRIIDCGVEIVITADGAYRRGAQSSLKPAVDEALKSCPDVRNVLVIQRTKQDTPMTEGRDLWWHEFVAKQSDDHVCEYFPPSIRSTSCTPQAVRVSRRASSIRRAATSLASHTRTGHHST